MGGEADVSGSSRRQSAKDIDADRRVVSETSSSFKKLAAEEQGRARRYLISVVAVVLMGIVGAAGVSFFAPSATLTVEAQLNPEHPLFSARENWVAASKERAVAQAELEELQKRIVADFAVPGVVWERVATSAGAGRAYRSIVLSDDRVLGVGSCSEMDWTGRFWLPERGEACGWIAAPDSKQRGFAFADVTGSIADVVELPSGQVIAVGDLKSMSGESTPLVKLDLVNRTSEPLVAFEPDIRLHTMAVAGTTLLVAGYRSPSVYRSDFVPYAASIDLAAPTAVAVPLVVTLDGGAPHGRFFGVKPGSDSSVAEGFYFAAQIDDYPAIATWEPNQPEVKLRLVREGEQEGTTLAFAYLPVSAQYNEADYILGGGTDDNWDSLYLWAKYGDRIVQIPTTFLGTNGVVQDYMEGRLVSGVRVDERWAMMGGMVEGRPAVVPVRPGDTSGAAMQVYPFPEQGWLVDLLRDGDRVLMTLSVGNRFAVYETKWLADKVMTWDDIAAWRDVAQRAIFVSDTLEGRLEDERSDAVNLAVLASAEKTPLNAFQSNIEGAKTFNTALAWVWAGVSIVVLGFYIYLLHLVISLHRYHLRRAAFYSSRATVMDVAVASGSPIDRFLALADALALDKHEFGAGVGLPADKLIEALARNR